jgi:hypothetical protein
LQTTLFFFEYGPRSEINAEKMRIRCWLTMNFLSTQNFKNILQNLTVCSWEMSSLRDPFAYALNQDEIPSSSDVSVQGTSDDACVSKLSAATLGKILHLHRMSFSTRLL